MENYSQAAYFAAAGSDPALQTVSKRDFSMSTQRFVAGILLALSMTASALAFERPFPQTAKRGTMSPATYPSIVIDGATRNLSVSVRIWNTSNLTQVPNSLDNSATYTVNYTENSQGDVDRIWLLTDEEASKPAPKDTPIRLQIQ